jgi:hypothetical protein
MRCCLLKRKKDPPMKHLIVLAGAAALGLSGAAFAGPGMGHGPGGMGHGNPHVMGTAGPHGIGFGARPAGPVGFGVGGCPPGLAKKAVPCVPPGQARQFAVGQRIPTSLGALLTFSALPRTVRTRFGERLDRRSRFLSSNGMLVSVNPGTRVVQRVIPMR